MKEGFEKVFSDIQTDMVSICLEYVDDNADIIYIYASFESNIISCDYFYRIEGILYERHALPEGYDVSIERQSMRKWKCETI